MEKKKISAIIRILKKRYPLKGRGEVSSSLKKRSFEVMVSAIISQRNRDEVTAKVASALLKRANTPMKMAKLGRREITSTIRSANYYKTKAKRIYDISRILVKEYNGRMPKTREELMKLPGIGGKTADIIMLVSHGAGVIPVDTHVEVISRRLGWSNGKTPEKIREDLHRIFPKKERSYVNILLVEFGKEFCRKHMPRCKVCPIEKLCPYPNKHL